MATVEAHQHALDRARARLWPHFETLGHQRHAAIVGTLAFLATEVMFFGGLFTSYVAYRFWSPEYTEAFAQGASHLKLLIGATNTAVLIGSSLTMALAVHAAQLGSRRALVTFLWLTVLLGLVFLGFKASEYYLEYEEQLVPGLAFDSARWVDVGVNPEHVKLFYTFYFFMTGLHAVHMLVGIGILVVLVGMAWFDWFSPIYHTPIEAAGLYWHFVDIIWIFLFPLLYLIARHGV
jgi:cytochrome c oxidase subunit 3